jgi:hypothetical protein
MSTRLVQLRRLFQRRYPDLDILYLDRLLA